MKNRIITILFLIPLLTVVSFASTQKPRHVVDFDYELDTIMVPIKVNGSKPMKAIFDTGMPNGVFIPHPEKAKALNLKYATTEAQVSGGGDETRTASVATGVEIELADIKLTGQQAVVLNDVTDIARYGFDAVIGASFFGNFVVEIDVPAKKIKFYDPKTFDASDAGQAHELTVTQTKPHIKGTVKTKGVLSKPLKIVIDTGARITMMINENQRLGVQIPEKHIEGVFGAGVGGDITARGARIDALNLGGHEFKGVTTQFSNSPVPAGGDALVGMRILKRFKMTFDYQNKKVYFKKNDLINEPFEFDLLGLVTRPREKGKIEITGVFEGSAAQKAGLKKGDFIVEADKKPVDFNGWSRLRDGIDNPGDKIDVVVLRDGKRLRKTLVASRLI